jgi:hypothetical protein
LRGKCPHVTNINVVPVDGNKKVGAAGVNTPNCRSIQKVTPVGRRGCVGLQLELLENKVYANAVSSDLVPSKHNGYMLSHSGFVPTMKYDYIPKLNSIGVQTFSVFETKFREVKMSHIALKSGIVVYHRYVLDSRVYQKFAKSLLVYGDVSGMHTVHRQNGKKSASSRVGVFFGPKIVAQNCLLRLLDKT